MRSTWREVANEDLIAEDEDSVEYAEEGGGARCSVAAGD